MAKTKNAHTNPSSPSYRPYVRANRELWDVWTRLHLAPGVYSVEDFKAGQSTLKPVEAREVGDVAGKTLLHLQCHFGLDTLSWARRGAIVTGVDFSPEAIAAARALSEELDIPARFACSDIYDLPNASELRDERFDVVFTSYGVLSWLPDLAKWARVIARFLKPGATFYIIEHHPFMYLADPETHDSAGNPLNHGYFYRRQPIRAEYSGSYADPEAEVWQTGYFWDHPLGEIVRALCDAGLCLEFLREHPRPTGMTYHPNYPDHLPYLFSIRARRPL